MATKRSGPTVTRGGTKAKPWVRFFTPGEGHPLYVAPRSAARRGAATKPAGPRGTTTVVPNPANPQLIVIADDQAVKVGGFPLADPTVAGGQATASAIGAVICDSGPMPAGKYLVEIRASASCVRTAGKQLQVEHRNAANAATINILSATPGEPLVTETFRIVLALNERIRIVVGAVAMGAGEIANGLVRLYLLPV